MSARQLLARLRHGSGPTIPVETPPPPLLESEGVCPVCDQATRFEARDAWLRDSFLCLNCGSRPRERAFFTVLNRVAPNWRDLRLHESSPSTADGKLARECAGYTLTHFDPGLELGAGGPEWRNEDLGHQTFADESFDLVVTQDVFEHLFEPDRAIAEIARTLKPGGMHVATVPLGRRALPSERRARRCEDGSVEHLMPPLFHLNPVNPEGSLVTIDWGYDIADYFDAHSGLNTTVYMLDDLSRGIRAEMVEVLVSRKGALPEV